eukprot:TRINITY_DN35_c0_g1_i1.p1 TRINITY_DN35_c0_g1~~TRINITY_DN35_c0_g1_i1.p1  ORF type:complete len:175 (+),score=71.57 TRINITY_DN35_c0_g1_i1:112-636(+)
MSAEKLTVKISVGEEMRRFTFESKPSFEQFKQQIFGGRGSGTIKYVDDENDLISLTNEREFNEAWSFGTSCDSKILRVRLTLGQATVADVPKEPKSEDDYAEQQRLIEEQRLQEERRIEEERLEAEYIRMQEDEARRLDEERLQKKLKDKGYNGSKKKLKGKEKKRKEEQRMKE